jgi:hypothetical protein
MRIATGEDPDDSNSPGTAATEMGRKGGKARAEKMTEEQRKETARRAAPALRLDCGIVTGVP